MNKKDLAIAFHTQGYNCAQAVLLTFAEELGLCPDKIPNLALCFGGGMGCGSFCGALTGAMMVLGMAQKASAPPAPEEKAAAMAKNRELIAAFESLKGTVFCKELLALPEGKDKKICPGLIGGAAEILEKLLN